jgi:hypothetical protein
MQDKNQFVDELLDSALAHQPGAEPRAGFEGRILARVHAVSRQSSHKGLWVAFTATAAAAVLVATIYVARRPHGPVAETSEAANSVPAPSPSETLTANSGAAPKTNLATSGIEPKRIARRQSKPSRRVESHHWPSQFPTPAPLTAEQKALVRYVQKTPPYVLATPILKADFTVHSVEIKHLKIAPLEIRPLSLGSTEEEMQ